MDYAKNHRLWRPLAAISGGEPPSTTTAALITITPMIANNRNGTTPITSTISTILDYTIRNNVLTSVAAADRDNNNVWYPVRFNRNSSLYFDDKVQDESTEVFYYSNVTLIGNVNNDNNYSFDDLLLSISSSVNSSSIDSTGDTIKLMAMVGTAIVLGFIILATVIGKFDDVDVVKCGQKMRKWTNGSKIQKLNLRRSAFAVYFILSFDHFVYIIYICICIVLMGQIYLICIYLIISCIMCKIRYMAKTR